MARLIVADSDVLIDAANGVEPSRTRIERELVAGNLATTAVNVFELLSVREATARESAERVLRRVTILPIDDAASREAAAIRRDLEARRAGIQLADCLVAGACRIRSATLLTRNLSHFSRVPGLSVTAP